MEQQKTCPSRQAGTSGGQNPLQQMVNSQLRAQQQQQLNFHAPIMAQQSHTFQFSHIKENTNNNHSNTKSSQPRIKSLSNTPEKYALSSKPQSCSRNLVIAKESNIPNGQSIQKQKTQQISQPIILEFPQTSSKHPSSQGYFHRPRGSYSNHTLGIPIPSSSNNNPQQQHKRVHSQATTNNNHYDSLHVSYISSRSNSYHEPFLMESKIHEKLPLKEEILQNQLNEKMKFNENLNKLLAKGRRKHSLEVAAKIKKTTLEPVGFDEHLSTPIDAQTLQPEMEVQGDQHNQIESLITLDNSLVDDARPTLKRFGKKRSGSNNIFEGRTKTEQSDIFEKVKQLERDTKTIQHDPKDVEVAKIETKQAASINNISQYVKLIQFQAIGNEKKKINNQENVNNFGKNMNGQDQSGQVVTGEKLVSSPDGRQVNLERRTNSQGERIISQESRVNSYDGRKRVNSLEDRLFIPQNNNSNHNQNNLNSSNIIMNNNTNPNSSNRFHSQERLRKMQMNFLSRKDSQPESQLRSALGSRKKVRPIPQAIGKVPQNNSAVFIPDSLNQTEQNEGKEMVDLPKNSVKWILNRQINDKKPSGKEDKSSSHHLNQTGDKNVLMKGLKNNFCDNMKKNNNNNRNTENENEGEEDLNEIIKNGIIQFQEYKGNMQPISSEMQGKQKSQEIINNIMNRSLLNHSAIQPPPPPVSRNGSRTSSVRQLLPIPETENTNSFKQLSFYSGFRTRKGMNNGVPKKSNQDSFFISPKMQCPNGNFIYLLGVMDGHGLYGHLVSQFVRSQLVAVEPKVFTEQAKTTEDYIASLNDLTESIHVKLHETGIDCSCSGTTMILLLLIVHNQEIQIISCNCGDSRAIMGLLKAAHSDPNHDFIGLENEKEQNGKNNSNNHSQTDKKSYKNNSLSKRPSHATGYEGQEILSTTGSTRKKSLPSNMSQKSNANTSGISQHYQSMHSSQQQQSSQFNSYLFEVLELSRDHKPELLDEKHRILSHNGRIESYRDEFYNQLGPMRVWLPDQNIPGIAMSRSIGDDIATSVGVTWRPEIKSFNVILQETDKSKFQEYHPDHLASSSKIDSDEGQKIEADSGFIVIGSDGVWEFLSNEEVVKEIGKHYVLNDLESACDQLLQNAYRQWTIQEDSVVDDITLIVIFIEKK